MPSSPSPDFTPEFRPLFHKPGNPIEGQRLYNHIRTVAFYLDAISALVPSLDQLPIQIGIEPIIAAFIPILGPIFGAMMGVYLIVLCCLFGISLWDLGKMVVNLLLDMCAGYIPLIGPFIDVAFKSNLANLGILESHLKRTKWSILTIPPPRRWFTPSSGRGSSARRGF